MHRGPLVGVNAGYYASAASFNPSIWSPNCAARSKSSRLAASFIWRSRVLSRAGSSSFAFRSHRVVLLARKRCPRLPQAPVPSEFFVVVLSRKKHEPFAEKASPCRLGRSSTHQKAGKRVDRGSDQCRTSQIAEQMFAVQMRRVITWKNSVFLRPGGRSA